MTTMKEALELLKKGWPGGAAAVDKTITWNYGGTDEEETSYAAVVHKVPGKANGCVQGRGETPMMAALNALQKAYAAKEKEDESTEEAEKCLEKVEPE